METDFKPLPLIKAEHCLLNKELERFNFDNPLMDPIELAHILTKNVIHYQGLALTATQLGLPYRAFVIVGAPVLCGFNPVIVDASSEQIYLEEVSLTHPGLKVKIKRPSIIKIRYTDPNGKTETHKYIGLTARLMQQMTDQLNGISFIKKASKYHLEQAKKQKEKV